jgi:hypothetical protein
MVESARRRYKEIPKPTQQDFADIPATAQTRSRWPILAEDQPKFLTHRSMNMSGRPSRSTALASNR